MLPLHVSSELDDREIDTKSILHYELGTMEPGNTEAAAVRRCVGNLVFQLRYDFIHRVLMLHIIRCSQLVSDEPPPTPYVKVYLLPGRRNHWKTRMFKKSDSPEFNEVFAFSVAYECLCFRMLQFIVYNFDRFARHGIIGTVIARDLMEKSDLRQWTEYSMKIVGSQAEDDYGDLLLYVAYASQIHKLYVTISKAYNLRPMDITGASDPYIKVEPIFQCKRTRAKRTSIKKANLNPVYHECLEFDVPLDQLSDTHLLIVAMDWDRIGRDDLLGCCVLGKESPTKEGRDQWARLLSSLHIPRRTNSIPVEELRKNGDHPSLAVENVEPSNLLCVGRENANERETNSSNSAVKRVHSSSSTGMRYLGELLTRRRTQSTSPPAATSNVIGQWHSLLSEVPEEFKNIPKVKK